MKSIKELYNALDLAGVPKHKTHDIIGSFEVITRFHSVLLAITQLALDVS